MTTTLYHGTAREGWTAHPGACLAETYEAALSYATWRAGTMGTAHVYAVTISEGLVTEDRTEEVDRDNQDYPGDTDRDVARLVAEGLDVVEYEDEDEQGRTLRCVRLLSAAAVASAVVIEMEIE